MRTLIFLLLLLSVNAQAGEYIVKVRPAVQKLGFKGKQFHTDSRYFTATMDSKAVETLRLSPDVEFVELDGTVRANQEPNDPSFSVQYALKNFGQKDRKEQVGVAGMDINVLPVWERGITGTKDVLVAVVDSGIEFTHPDLAPNIFKNQAEIPNGKDDDGNGFIDDLQGWNFERGNNAPIDGFGHGSHVAGIIGAVGNDGIGMSGVAWKVTLLPIKALDDSGSGKISKTIEAINYARLMKAKIINMSLGTDQYSRAFEEAIENAEKDGILVVVAAGNDNNNNDERPYYPASFKTPNLIATAAIDNQGKPVDWTNYGKRSVHIAAPGVWIYSTVTGGKYIYAAGTSMAAPHVTGAAVLLKTAHPEWDYRDVVRRILSSCEPNPTLKDKVSCGGHLNVARALL